MRCGRLKVSNIFVIDEISNEDTRFLKVEIDVLHTGLNFNNSVFDKDVVNENGKIVAVFTLAHKAVEIGSTNLSNSKRKKISRYAILDSESDNYTVSAFLIAQFGKNYAVDEGKGINGNELMDLTFEILEKVQHDIGGGIVFLECEDKVKLLNFYQSEKNGFMPFNERYSVNDNTKYIQLFNFF